MVWHHPAAAILGVGTGAVVDLPTDDLGVVRSEGVLPTLERVEREGRRVLAVVVNACATSTGLHDPVEAVARTCRERGVWCHVDGAHGGSALLSPRLRTRLAGLELADSMCWDAHKMLRTSVLCAAALFRDPGSAHAAFQQDVAYFTAVDLARENVFEKAIECTKTGLGLKLFLVLARHGEAGLRQHVETLYDRAAEFHAARS